MSALLAVAGLQKSFRGLRAVNGVSFDVRAGEIVALIGPNGAGKTTIFNLISGAYRPDGGSVTLAGRRLDGLRPDQICDAGVGRTFQLVRPFKALSVRDNVVIGALHGTDDVDAAGAHADEILHTLDLHRRSHLRPPEITLPDRKRLEVARALATRPKILLLDEVMAGLRPTETDQMVATFRELNARTGLTIVLIEHVMRAVMALSERVLVLHHGDLIAAGAPEDVVRDPAVLECYLGEDTD